MRLDEQLRAESQQPKSQTYGQVVVYRVDELRPHPSYARHHLTVTALQLSALAERGDLALREPIAITQDRIILNGYARVELARLRGQLMLPCIEYKLTEEEALCWLLQRHRRSNGLRDFTRILLALELEPWLKAKARSNQKAGGQHKESSKLTEAETLDVRREIATAAGVCPANVTKVKQLTLAVRPQLLQALHSGEISIHRAWLWSKRPPDKQFVELRRFRDNRATNKIKRLVSRHNSEGMAVEADPSGVVRRLAGLESNELATVNVRVVKGPGKALFLTEDLLRLLPPCQEEMPR